MSKLSGGDIVNKTLVDFGVEYVFGIVSVHNIAIYDAIARGGVIKTIDSRHEQGAVHEADGYARATGKLGVAITSTGPGAANGVSGLYEAAHASSPVLMITGQTETQFYGRGKGVQHEFEKQLDMLGTVTRTCASPKSTAEIGPELQRVIADITSGRPQPGAMEIPVNLQYEEIEYEPAVPPEQAPREPEPGALTDAISLLASARQPLILAGGGVIRGGASAELVKLAESMNAPVFTTVGGKGAIPENHPLSMGVNLFQGREIIAEADLVLAVGTRFQGDATGNFQVDLPGSLVHLDVDPSMIDLNYKADVALIADAKRGLAAILSGINPQPASDDFPDRLREARDAGVEVTRRRLGPDYELIMDTIREELPAKGNVVRDTTISAFLWANTAFPIYEPRTSIHCTPSSIGPAFPLAIGASLGSGNKSVVIQGDGGFMLNMQELATAAQYQVPVIICLFNDGGYGVLRIIEAMRFEGRNFGVNLHTPDFAAMAEAMGVSGIKVSAIEEFQPAFKQAMAASGPVLIDIDVTNMIPMQPWGKIREP